MTLSAALSVRTRCLRIARMTFLDSLTVTVLVAPGWIVLEDEPTVRALSPSFLAVLRLTVSLAETLHTMKQRTL